MKVVVFYECDNNECVQIDFCDGKKSVYISDDVINWFIEGFFRFQFVVFVFEV